MHHCVRGGCVATLLLLLLSHTAAAQYLFNRADFAAGNGATSLVVADFNGDGAPDLATVNKWDHTVSVLLADHHGSFAAKVNYDTLVGGELLVAGDFNGDGKLDLFVPSLAMLFGNGDGTFRVQRSNGVYALFVTTGDLNGDGKLDLVTIDRNTDTISVWLGNGDGSFGSGVAYSTSCRTGLHRDGRLQWRWET